MADNARFHNKLHRKNHHTLPTPGYPDSATDPIASHEEPFTGDFVVNASISANSNLFVNNNAIILGKVGINTTEPLDSRLTVRGSITASEGLSAYNSLFWHYVSSAELRAFYTNSNHVTANYIFGYENESIFTDGTNLDGNGDKTLTINYVNGLILSSAPVHFPLARGAGTGLIFARDSSANLYRNAAATLRTDGSLLVNTNLSAFGNTTLGNENTDITTVRGTVRIADSDSDAIVFGSGDANYDTNLYRNSSNVLKTDDNLIVGLQLSAMSINYDNLINNGISAIATDPEYHLLRGRVGINTFPLSTFGLHLKGGNIRVDGVDYSRTDIPGELLSGAFDTDGQSLFDLRSGAVNDNYSLSISESGVNHFMKFFGGRTNDNKAFINVKRGDPLRFGSFASFYGVDFEEYIRVGGNGNIGIGINHPYVDGEYDNEPDAKLTVNGSISSNDTFDARRILSAGIDLWSLGLGGGGGTLTSDITTDLAVGALTALSILRSGATLQHCMERLLTQVYFPTVNPFASGGMTAVVNSVTISSGAQREVGEITTSFTGALNAGSWRGNLVGGVWDANAIQIPAAGAANNYLFFGVVDNLTNTVLTTAARINDGTNSYAINIGFDAGAQPINSKSVLQPAFGPGRAPGTMTIIGRRKLFYSNDTSTSAPADTTAVRGLTGVIGSGSTWPNNGTTFNIPIYTGTKRIVIAYPTTFGTISEIRNGLGFNVTTDFTQTTVSVDGANSLFPTNYYVYTYIAVGAFESDETYSVIV